MPNRELRERIRFSEKIAALKDKEFRLFVLLISCVDDYGRYDGNPKLILSACFPYGTEKLKVVEKTLNALSDKDLIGLYEIEGKIYLQMKQWKSRKRSHPKFPAPQGFIKNCQQPADSGQPITNNDNVYTNNDNVYTEGFLLFWETYPKKRAKDKAWKAWQTNGCEARREEILSALSNHIDLPEWLKDDGQFIPYPASWLNAKRWEDVIEGGKSYLDPFDQAVEDCAKEIFKRYHFQGNDGVQEYTDTLYDKFKDMGIKNGGTVKDAAIVLGRHKIKKDSISAMMMQ